MIGKTKVSVTRVGEIFSSIERAINLAGGISLEGKETVLIKPNAVFGLKPSTGIVTNPEIIDGVIKYLLSKGIEPQKISLGDCSAMGYDTSKAFRFSGMTDVCKTHGVKIVEFFKKGCIRKDISLKGTKLCIDIAREVFEADVLIGVPVIKTHFQSEVSMSLKNMFGTASWDSRKELHKMGLTDGIAYLNTLLPKYFTVGDATIGLQGNGPALLGKPGNWGLIFASTNPVAHDAMVCQLFGLDIPKHVKKAGELGLGMADTEKIELVGESRSSIRRKIERPGKDITPLKNVDIVDGDACSYCMNNLWTVLLKLSKEDLKSDKKIQVLIGNIIKECDINLHKQKVICGNCAIKYRHLSNNVIPGCPPETKKIILTLREILNKRL